MSQISKSKATPFSGRARVKSTIVPPGSSLCSSPTIHSKVSAEFVDRIHYYLALPSFTFDNFIIDINAEPVASFHYVVPESISIIEIPERSSTVNYNLVVVIDGVRYKIWDENEFGFPIELYTGQRLGVEFDIEIWATDNNTVVADEIRMMTSTLVDPTRCELTCEDAADIQEAYSILIPFQFASFAERATLTVSFSAAYLELVLLDLYNEASLNAELREGSQYSYSLEDIYTISVTLESGQQFAPTFDSTMFTFDSTILTWDTNVT